MKESDPFYNDIGGFGSYLRIPLIKPYEANLINGKEWRVALSTPQLLELSIHHVVSLNIINDVILIHSEGEISIKNVASNVGWFAIIPSRNLEEGFTNKTDFVNYLSVLNIINPVLHNVDSIYKHFAKYKKIEWNHPD